MIASVLSQKFKVVASEDHQNIARNYTEPLYKMYTGDYRTGIFESAEMLASKYGDFTSDIAVATNVGEAHLEDFLTRDRIFDRVLGVLGLMRAAGHCYVDGCDEYLKKVALKKPRCVRMYGMSPEMEYHSENISNLGINGVNCDLVRGGDRVNVTIPVPGLQFINAALVSFAIGLDYGVSLEDIKRGIESYQTSKLRSKVFRTGMVSIIEDTYNSSPMSVRAAADTLSTLEGRKVMIWGDMLKLGDSTEKLHEETLEYIVNSKVDLLISVGAKGVNEKRDAASMRAGECIKSAVDRHADTLKFIRVAEPLDLLDLLPSVIKKGDSIFVKGDADLNKQFHKVVLALKGYEDSGRIKFVNTVTKRLDRAMLALRGRFSSAK